MSIRPVETNVARLTDLSRCFQGVIPSVIATSDRSGVPNVTYVSQVYLVDDRHVALSCQFFNKTRRNLEANPHVCAEVYDPLTFDCWRLRLKHLRSETRGPLFDAMKLRIEAIASHTGMSGVFRLLAADVFEVIRFDRVEGFLSEPPPAPEPMSADGFKTELRGLQLVSETINRARDLESLLDAVLESLDSYFDFHHTMVLLNDESCGKLVTMASRGYEDRGVGAEVAIGEGLIGMVARERKPLCMTGLHEGLRYGRAVRRETEDSGCSVAPEIPLPGLPEAQSALILPLKLGERLVGVLAAESRRATGFGTWHEAYLEIIANQIALGIDRMLERDADETESAVAAEPPAPSAQGTTTRKRSLVYYRNDDCIFADGEYLIRNVPARILWKLLGEWRRDGRSEFSNRELRLDDALGLPAVKDNLESRLILLRHRLQEKCPDIRLVPTARGRFALVIESSVELVER